MVEWRIWYGDGSSYSDADGSPFDAPGRFVVAVAQAEPAVGRWVFAQRDFYWWVAEQRVWFGGDIFGLWDFLVEPGPKKVVFGRNMKNADYQEVIKRLLADPTLPAKTARHPDEVF